MLYVLLIGNFLGATIFDLPLSIEDLATFFWFGCPEMGGSEKENPGGDSGSVSLPFLSFIATNSFLMFDDFHF